MLDSIIPDIEKTASLIQEIASSSSEQQLGAEQINQSLQQLNVVTQDVASTAEEMAASFSELDSDAKELVRLVTFFKSNQ